MADHWALTPDPYVEGGLVLHGFKEREEAERFATLNLPGWIALPVGERREGHRSVCAECGTEWPCAHERVEREATTILHQSRNACHACGKSVQGCLRVTAKGAGDLGQDLVFHGRQGKCRNAAVKLLRCLDRVDDLRRLEEEDERRRKWRKDREARNAEERRRLREQVAREVAAEREEEQRAIAEGVMG